MSKTSLSLAALAASLALTGCVTPGAGGLVSTGNSPTAATGAAAGGTSVNANANLERCDEPLGTLAVTMAAARNGMRASAPPPTSPPSSR